MMYNAHCEGFLNDFLRVTPSFEPLPHDSLASSALIRLLSLYSTPLPAY
jgi:hypothetical protein